MQPFLIYLFLKTLYMFQAVPPPIIRNAQLYKQLQVFSTSTAASCYRGWDGTRFSWLVQKLLVGDTQEDMLKKSFWD